jgi:hypothetical protein
MIRARRLVRQIQALRLGSGPTIIRRVDVEITRRFSHLEMDERAVAIDTSIPTDQLPRLVNRLIHKFQKILSDFHNSLLTSRFRRDYLLTVPLRPRGAPVSSPAWSGMRRTRRDHGPFCAERADEASFARS